MDATWFSSAMEHMDPNVIDDTECHRQKLPESISSSLETILAHGSDWNILLQGAVNMCVSFEKERQRSKGAGKGEDVDDTYYLLVTTRSMMQQMSPEFFLSESGSGGSPEDAECRASVVNRIQIKYVETLQDIIRLGSVLHLMMRQGRGSENMGSTRPCVVVLHGLDRIVDASHGISSSLAVMPGGGPRGKPSRYIVELLLCRAMAIVKDAVENTSGNHSSILCATLWSECIEDPPRYFFCVSRWLRVMYGFYSSEAPGKDWYYAVSKIEFDALTHKPGRVGPIIYLQKQRVHNS